MPGFVLGLGENLSERDKPFTIFLITDFRLELSSSSPTGASKECMHKLLA